MKFSTPILFLVYKNAKATKEVFNEIIKLKPLKLYIAADGPKNDSEEVECLDVRAVTDNIDWECEVHRRYLDKNLGCKKAVSSAISWFFDNEDRGIILEYDCLPHASFFSFCEDMLEKYNDNESVMHISGSNFQDGLLRGEDDSSYYFSAITGVWGWATWKRSWACYDPNANDIEDFIDSGRIHKLLTARRTRKHWSKRFLNVKSGVNTSSWAIPWAYSVMKYGGLCINPNKNLVSNIGFNADATHAFDESSEFSCVPVVNIGKITHPKHIFIDFEADNYATRKSYAVEDSLSVVIKLNIKRYFFPFLPKVVKNTLLKFNQIFLK